MLGYGFGVIGWSKISLQEIDILVSKSRNPLPNRSFKI